METVACIFCGGANGSVVIEENGYTGKRCPQCRLIYVSPRPSYAEVVNLYGHDDAQVSAVSHIAAEFSSRLYARHSLRILTSIVRTGSILEIGAGAGFFLDEARRLGFEPYAIELNPLQATFIRNRLKIPCEQAPLSPTVFAGKRFDVIYHCDVISHFFDPIAEFTKIRARMNDGGLLIFETGNLAEVSDRFLRRVRRFQYPDHLFFFSVENIKKLLERTGYEYVTTYRYSLLPQLRLEGVLSRVRQRIRPQRSRDPSRNGGAPESTSAPSIDALPVIGKSRPRRSLGMAWHYVNYVLRYKVGYIAPKAARPQTLIVIAKKKGGAVSVDREHRGATGAAGTAEPLAAAPRASQTLLS